MISQSLAKKTKEQSIVCIYLITSKNSYPIDIITIINVVTTSVKLNVILLLNGCK